MSEAQNPFEYGSGANPYGVAPANNVSLAETQRHDMGNVGAANTEARTVAEVKAQVLMSRQFPRDPRSCMERILRECERPTLAEKATYTFPRGKGNRERPVHPTRGDDDAELGELHHRPRSAGTQG